MSAALERIIEAVKSLTAEERRELLRRLGEHSTESNLRALRRPGTLRGTVKYMAPDFDAPLDDLREYTE